MGIDISFMKVPHHPENEEFSEERPSPFALEEIAHVHGNRWLRDWYFNLASKYKDNPYGDYVRIDSSILKKLREDILKEVKEYYEQEFLLVELSKVVADIYSNPDNLYDYYVEADW